MQEAVHDLLATALRRDRALHGQATRQGMAIRRAQGVRLGRPSQLSAELVARIVRDHDAGASLRTIAAALTGEGIPTARGGAQWTHSTVQAVLLGQDAARQRTTS